ncbi:hypothetical protein Ancab_002147 [Ancistrocladus abbreviatus]
MESCSSDTMDSTLKEPLLSPQKGGFRTLPFIIANEAFERVASYGLMPNMILYLMREYGMQMSTGTNILFFWSAATNFAPIIGALLADSYVGRFRMIGFGSFLSLLGMTLLWSTAMISEARPSCDEFSPQSCTSPTAFQLIFLFSSFLLMSMGAGGIRSSSLAFGVDQLNDIDNLGNSRVLESFFSWYYFSITFSLMAALTCIVYLQDHMGWKMGFGVPVLLMLLSALSFFLASPFYVKLKAKTSLLTGFARVLMASWRNRHIEFSYHSSDQLYHCAKGSTLSVPTEKLRFLNKACIVKNAQEDLTPDGRASNPWHLCTIDQVEELKALIKVIPLWSTGIMMCVSMSQNSFRLIQANSMDRHVFSSSFEIPAGSFGMFILLSLTLWLALYDRIVLPLASKLMGKPVRLAVKTRMGIGLLLSVIAMVVSAIVESKRRELALKEETSSAPQVIAPMSALWLVPPLCLFGLSEAFATIGQNEFFFSEFPRSMSSIASALFGVGTAVASFIASLIMSIIDHVTRREGKESWVSGDINKGHYDYYYWVLAGLNLLNFLYFIICSRAYGPCEGERGKMFDEKKETIDE